MSKNFVTIFLSLFVLCSPLPWAQHYTFRDFSLEQGLPQSEVNAITDDHLGYLWIGTNGGGLCRFDGRTFDANRPLSREIAAVYAATVRGESSWSGRWLTRV